MQKNTISHHMIHTDKSIGRRRRRKKERKKERKKLQAVKPWIFPLLLLFLLLCINTTGSSESCASMDPGPVGAYYKPSSPNGIPPFFTLMTWYVVANAYPPLSYILKLVNWIINSFHILFGEKKAKNQGYFRSSSLYIYDLVDLELDWEYIWFVMIQGLDWSYL